MRMKGYTTFRPGELVPGLGLTERVTRLAEMLDVIDQAQATSDLESERWTKLALNCVMNAPQAVSGFGYQEVAASAAGRRTMILAAAEACRVAAARGHTVGAVHGRPAEEWAAAIEDPRVFDELDQYLTPKGPVPKTGGTWESPGTKSNWKVSMPQDVAKRRRTEVQFLNGLVASTGADHGISAPVNAALTAAVEHITAGELRPEEANLDAVASAAPAPTAGGATEERSR